MTLLRADNLVRRYPSRRRLFGHASFVHAVNGVSLTISRGETVGLVGESGSGKSTTGRLLLGLEKPDAGNVWFENNPLPKPDSFGWRHLRPRMQMVFQDPLAALNRQLTIRQHIEEPLTIHRLGQTFERRERSLDLLHSVGLRADHGDRYPHELSGGQRQRAVLARALATNPDLLICDEPISALDVSIQAQIMNLLSDIQEKFGTAILFISHDLRAVRQLCSRVAVMYLGSIVEEGLTEDVLLHPRHPYTQALISAVPDYTGVRRNRIRLQGEPPNPANRPTGCAFHTRCSFALDACSRTSPPLQPLADGNRKVSCHRTDPRTGNIVDERGVG